MWVVLLLRASTDVVIGREGRSLPLVFVSALIGSVWLQHMLAFPGVLPFTLPPLVTNQTATFLFQAAHIGTPALYAWILLHRPRPLAQPRRSLRRAVALALGVSLLAVGLTAALALVLPPVIIRGRFTEFNTRLQAGPLVVVAFVAAGYRQGRCPDRLIEGSGLAGLVLVTVGSMISMFTRAPYADFW